MGRLVILMTFSADRPQLMPLTVFSGLRTYALCQRYRVPLGVLVFVLSMIPMGINLVSSRICSLYAFTCLSSCRPTTVGWAPLRILYLDASRRSHLPSKFLNSECVHSIEVVVVNLTSGTVVRISVMDILWFERY